MLSQMLITDEGREKIFGQVWQYIYTGHFRGHFSSISEYLSSKQRGKQERPRIQERVDSSSRDKKGSPRLRARGWPQTRVENGVGAWEPLVAVSSGKWRSK